MSDPLATRLPDRSFYDRDAVQVARQLLGALLVRACDDTRLVGRIVETEAYLAEGDSACHASRGRTRRNATMFGPPGRAYVYSIHARYCLNIVTQPENVPSAVLIRAVEPLEGVEAMRLRRSVDRYVDLTNGPAKLCEALNLDRRWDGWDLTTGRRLWVEEDGEFEVMDGQIGRSIRIGVTSAKDLELRFYLRGNPFVSGPQRLRS